jgi:hypothetical protein
MGEIMGLLVTGHAQPDGTAALDKEHEVNSHESLPSVGLS